MIPADPDDDGGPPRWLRALEAAHALALRAGRALEAAPPSGADLRPAARSIEAALASIYAAFDRRGDRLDATRAADEELDTAAAVLGTLAGVDPSFPLAEEWLNEARDALAVAEERFTRVPAEEAPPPAPLRASQGVPALHRIAREAVAPILRVAEPLPSPPDDPPPLPKPKSLAELAATMAEVKRRAEERRAARQAREAERAQARTAKEAARAADPGEPPPGFARGRFTAMSPAAVIAARTRECFDEIAMIGVQRAPLLGDPFRAARFLEDRMLASIDAIAALGSPALARIEPLVLDAPAKDPSRGFAAAMVLGCFEGRDALGAVERVLRHLDPADPEVALHVGGALKLVPHPLVGALLRALLADRDPACRALAVEVLAYRGLATAAELAAAAQDPSPLVAAAALPALALARAGDAGEAIERARVHADPALREAGWAALVLGGHARAPEVLARELTGSLGARAALHLALVGDERDAARLLEAMTAAPTSALVAAVGWAGSPLAIPALLALLEHDDPVLQLTAAYALDRLTGARLYETTEVPPEVIAVPDVATPEVGEPKAPPLARLVSDPRDRPAEGANDTITQPTIRVDRWRAYWSEKGASFRAAGRYRRGLPYAPTVSLWELDAWPVTPAERRALQRELVVRTGHYVRFDPHDFVVVQEEALREWAPIAQRMSGNAGAWTRPMRR